MATLFWATNVVLGRFLIDKIGPLTLSACRSAVASLCFLLLIQRGPKRERWIRKDVLLLVAMSLCGVTLFSPTLYFGLRYTTAVNATLVLSLSPLITGFMAAVMIKAPMSGRQVVGAVAAILGVLILVSGGALRSFLDIAGKLGDLIILTAAIMLALYSVSGQVVMRCRATISVTAWSIFLSLPPLLLAAIWETRVFPVKFSLTLVAAIIFIGVASTAGGFLCWNAGIRRLGPNGAMAFYNTLPLYGMLLAFVVLHESLSAMHVIGGVFIIGGGLWASIGRA
jgi:drug/metabolite transporter (DMT)-like permease